MYEEPTAGSEGCSGCIVGGMITLLVWFTIYMVLWEVWEWLT
jgi:hypothetical protein